MNKTHKTSLALLGLMMTLPAQAATVTMPDGVNHELRFDWNRDVENQWLLLAPRAPAVILGTERVARTALANAQRRQADVRGALVLGEGNAEGGVWARVGGAFGQQDSIDLRVGVLSRPISGLDTVPIETSEDLLAYAATGLGTRLGQRYLAHYAGQDWFDALDPADQAAVVAGATASAVTDLGYDEQISHFNVGVDFISGTQAEGAWILGGAIGYVRASQEFDDFKTIGQGSKFDWDSVNLGTYASYVKGGAYIDAALSYAWHSIDLKMPVLNMVPAGSLIGTDGQSLALSLEAGWRLNLSNSLYLEPQLAAVWVQSDLQDAKVQRADALTYSGQFNTLHYGDPESRRIGLGTELGRDWRLSSLTLTASLNARYWIETETDRRVSLWTPATRVNTAMVDEQPTQVALPTLEAEASSYTQVTLGTHLRNADSSLSGGLSLDYLTGGDFDSYGVTASLRYQW